MVSSKQSAAAIGKKIDELLALAKELPGEPAAGSQ